MVLDVFGPYLIGHVAAARDPIALADSCWPQYRFRSAPNSLSSLCELRPFSYCMAREPDRLGGIDSSVVPIDGPGVYDPLMRAGRLAARGTAAHISIEHLKKGPGYIRGDVIAPTESFFAEVRNLFAILTACGSMISSAIFCANITSPVGRLLPGTKHS